MNPKQITLVINDFTVGGAQKLFIQLANRFVQDGYDVEFISLVILEGKTDLLHEVLPEIKVTRLQFKSAFDLKSWWLLFRLLNKKKSLILSTLFLANMTTRILKLFHWRKVIIVEQNTYDNKVKSQILMDWILSFLTKKIICTSESVLSFTQKQEHIPHSKFTVIHSGVDIAQLKSKTTEQDREVIRQEFDLALDVKIFLNVGRLAEQKSQDKLLRAFAIFLKHQAEKEKYVLMIVGEGKERKSLETLTYDLQIDKSVVFTGVRTDAARFYNAADFFVSSSRIEGFSIVHAEAMAFGLPVVTTRTAGPDIMVLEGQNGFFVDFTAESLADGLQKIVEAPYTVFAEASRLRVKSFTIEATYEKYYNILQSF